MKLTRRAFAKLGGMAGLVGAIPHAWAGAIGYPRALQGPMIGAPGPDSITVWVRASGSFDVALEISTDPDFEAFRTASIRRARAEDACCVVLQATGLRPDTTYWYRLRFAGEQDRYQPLPHRTRTAPAGVRYSTRRFLTESSGSTMFAPEHRRREFRAHIGLL